MQTSIVLLLLLPVVLTLKCYDYQQTSNYQNTYHTWVDCPMNTMYCYKSYIEQRDFNGMKTWSENRGCGTPNLCQREGCLGDDRDRACCCSKDNCNSAQTSVPIMASTFAAFYLLI